MKEYTSFTNAFFNPLHIFIAFIYTFLFFLGLINLAIFSLRKLQNKPLTDLNYPKKELPLNPEESTKLIFLLILLVLLTYIMPSLLWLAAGIKALYAVLTANLFLQITSILVLLFSLKISFFGFSIKKKEVNFVFQAYAALLPLVFAGLALNLFFLERLGIKPSPSPVEIIAPLIETRFAFFLFAFQTILVGPLAEEFVFRGLFYKLLRKKYSFLFSTTILSLFFSLLHRSPAGFISLFVLSAGMCYVYEKTQKISTPFLLHSLHNLIIFLFFAATKSV